MPFVEDDHRCKTRRSSEKELVEVGQNEGWPTVEIQLAEWVCGFFGQSVCGRDSKEVHPKSGNAPQKEIVREEVLHILDQYKVEYNEKYLWD